MLEVERDDLGGPSLGHPPDLGRRRIEPDRGLPPLARRTPEQDNLIALGMPIVLGILVTIVLGLLAGDKIERQAPSIVLGLRAAEELDSA